MSQRVIIGLLALSTVAAGCASGGSSSAPAATTSTANTTAANTTRRNPNLITQAEITGSGLENLYDVVERLRPSMLRARGPAGRLSGATESSSGATSSAIKVYVNGSLAGDTSALRSIQASNVKEVKFLSASEATTFFGTGVDSGAIVVTLR